MSSAPSPVPARRWPASRRSASSSRPPGAGHGPRREVPATGRRDQGPRGRRLHGRCRHLGLLDLRTRGDRLSTDPDSGGALAKGTVIDLVVSNGKVQLPDVTQQPITTALARLAELGLTAQSTPSNACTGNTVTQQSVPASDVAQGSTVMLTYCAAPAQRTAALGPRRTAGTRTAAGTRRRRPGRRRRLTASGLPPDQRFRTVAVRGVRPRCACSAPHRGPRDGAARGPGRRPGGSAPTAGSGCVRQVVGLVVGLVFDLIRPPATGGSRLAAVRGADHAGGDSSRRRNRPEPAAVRVGSVRVGSGRRRRPSVCGASGDERTESGRTLGGAAEARGLEPVAHHPVATLGQDGLGCGTARRNTGAPRCWTPMMTPPASERSPSARRARCRRRSPAVVTAWP